MLLCRQPHATSGCPTLPSLSCCRPRFAVEMQDLKLVCYTLDIPCPCAWLLVQMIRQSASRMQIRTAAEGRAVSLHSSGCAPPPASPCPEQRLNSRRRRAKCPAFPVTCRHSAQDSTGVLQEPGLHDELAAKVSRLLVALEAGFVCSFLNRRHRMQCSSEGPPGAPRPTTNAKPSIFGKHDLVGSN